MSSSFQNNDSPLKANGRFGRLSYLGWNGLSLIGALICVFILTSLIPNTMSENPFPPLILIIFFIIYIPLIYFNFIFAIRRLHDLNVSGWASLLLLIPVLNIILGICLAFVGGENEDNQYGAPRATQTWEKVLGWIYILIFPLGILAAIAIPAYQDYVQRAHTQQYEQQINRQSE